MAPRNVDHPGYRQAITRIPPFRPGAWVKLRTVAGWDLSGKVLPVKALTCSITRPEQRLAVWRVHFAGGRSALASAVERPAWPDEIAAAPGRER
jgi:hypothetical protein